MAFNCFFFFYRFIPCCEHLFLESTCIISIYEHRKLNYWEVFFLHPRAHTVWKCVHIQFNLENVNWQTNSRKNVLLQKNENNFFIKNNFSKMSSANSLTKNFKKLPRIRILPFVWEWDYSMPPQNRSFEAASSRLSKTIFNNISSTKSTFLGESKG